MYLMKMENETQKGEDLCSQAVYTSAGACHSQVFSKSPAGGFQTWPTKVFKHGQLNLVFSQELVFASDHHLPAPEFSPEPVALFLI